MTGLHRSALSRALAAAAPLLLLLACGTAEQPGDVQPADLHSTRVHKMPMRDSNSITPFSAPAGAHLTYYGGRVNAATNVVNVLWGSGSYESHVSGSGTPSMTSFYNQVLGNGALTTFLDNEYNTVSPSGTKTNQHIGTGTAAAPVTITPSISGTVDDTQIQAELTRQINAGHLPAPVRDAAGNATSYYAIFFPPGVTITQGGSSSCVSGGFCAYHGTVAAAGSLGEYYYGVHPDMQAGSGCATGCGSSSVFGNYTSVASHELVEMITDAEVGLATVNGPPLAWYDSTNGEIGDICNAQQSTYTGCDGQSYTVQNEFSNAQSNCIPYPAPSCGAVTPDFSISASPASVSIVQGGSGSATVSTAVSGTGGTGTVSLSASVTGTGVTASLSPTSVTAGGSSTLSITVASSATTGSHTVTITGTEGTKTHSATVTVTVTSPTTNDFSISVSPASVTIAAGSSGSSTVSTATVSGTAQTVNLSVAGAPSGVTATVSPTSITSGQSATLTINTTSSAAAGTFNLAITGTGTSATHGTTVSVTVTTSGGGGSALVNGTFETGSLSGWTAAGASETTVNTGCHGGTYCARLGNTTATNGDSSISQTFTAATGNTGISLWYKETCPDTVTYDWALATLKDNTAGTTATLIAKACTTNAWTNVTGSVTAGHSYTITLTSHDDNYAGDPTYTLYDDVTLTSSSGGGGGLTNGGFESGATGWTTAGTTSVATTGCHTGSCGQAGSTSPTNGDSSFSQTFTVPSGKSQLSIWYKMTCPDTVTYDWVTITLKNNSTAATTTVVPKTCTTNSWTNVTAAVTAGTSYTVTLTSHDDNYSADPSYTLFDDVTLN